MPTSVNIANDSDGEAANGNTVNIIMPFPSSKSFAEKMSFICFNTSILIGGIGIAKGEKSDAEDLFKKAFVIQL